MASRLRLSIRSVLAASSRRGVRAYSTPARGGQPQQKIGEVFTRKSFGEAWRGLTPNQRLSFFAFVGIGGALEYYLLKSYILDPIKARKLAQEAETAENELRAAGGGEKEVLFE